MARGTRGKLKENLEGIHRNCDWIKAHCAKSLGLLTDEHPDLQKSFSGLAEIANELDKFTQEIYVHI